MLVLMIVLYFGSFDPVHWGHLIIADSVLRYKHITKVVFIPSLISPFKFISPPPAHHTKAKRTKDKQQSKALLQKNFRRRFEMLRLATAEWERLTVSDIEGTLPFPSYTSTTLRVLAQQKAFSKLALLMGTDNLHSLPEWKEGKWIAKNFPLYVYSREHAQQKKTAKSLAKASPVTQSAIPFTALALHTLEKIPLLPFSSTEVRARLSKEQPIDHLVPPIVKEYLTVHRDELYPPSSS